MKTFKGINGLTTAGLLVSVIFVFALSALYIIPAIASVITLSSPAVAPTTVTNGQKLPSLNFTVTVGANLTQVRLNFSVIGSNTVGNFSLPASISNDSVICGGKTINLPGWQSTINVTSVTCVYNASTNFENPMNVFNLSIVNGSNPVYVPSQSGTYYFNLSALVNGSTADENSTLISLVVSKIAGRATVNVSTAEIGKNQSLQFTITNTADSDRAINKIVVNFSSAGFVAPTAVSCPGLGNGGAGWGAATIGDNDVTCSQGSGTTLGAGASTTIILNGTAAGQTGGIKPFNVGLYDTTVGEFANFTNSTSITVYGLLNITGSNKAPGTVYINTNSTNNGTQFTAFNFSSRGEGMNITAITIVRTGTAQDADILEVAIYNTTPNVANGSIPNMSALQLIGVVTTPDSLGRYDFKNFQWNITGTADGVDQWLYVVANVSRSATGGRTVGFMINNTGNVTTTSAISSQSITEALNTGASNNATIVGNLTITGTTDAPSGIVRGTTNVSMIRYNFAPSGEQMNVTILNISRTGTAADADVVAVGLYNSSSDGTSVFTANATLIAWNTSVPANGVYNFSGLGFNVTTSGNVLLVVVNISATATGGGTIGFRIDGAANITTNSSVSNQPITETFSTSYSSNASIAGNLTITGVNKAPSLITMNTNGTINGTHFVAFNFSTRGEGMNITYINITRTGTAQDADILEVAIYNTTPNVANGSIPNMSALQLIGKNLSAPRADGTYNFSDFQWNITGTADGVDQWLYVVANVSRSATAGRTVGFMITSAGNLTTTSAISGQSITEYLVTPASNNATIVGNLTITGTDGLAATTTLGSTNVSAIRFNFAAGGEQMNVTQIVLARTGNVSDANVIAVGLYNSSSDGSSVFTANATLIGWNSTVPESSGWYTFSNITFNVSTAGNQLLVVVNLSSSTAVNSTIGFLLNGTGNITVRSSVSNQSITPVLSTTSTVNTTIVGGLTITGTSRIGSSVAVGTKNVTAISYNFTVTGEQMNITAINVSRTGSATDADVTAVGLFYGTNTTYAGNEGSMTLIAWNTSVPSTGVYNFSGIGFNVSAGATTGNVLLVVVNLTNVATTGRNIGFRIDSAANITTASSITNASITETFSTSYSGNASIYGNLTITGTSRIVSTLTIGTRNISVVSYNFTAFGEGMNLTAINLTLTGTASTSDIESVGLFHGTNTTFNVETMVQLARNSSAPRADGTYNFTGLDFSVNTSDLDDNILVVVINFTAGSTTTGGKTVGFTIKAANVSVTAGIGGVSITPTLATEASNNATIAGNLTVSTTSDISADVKINQKRVAFLNLSFMARGEQVNVTNVNLTLKGNASFANVSEIRLFNDDGSATGSLDSTDTVIAGTATAPSSSRVTVTPTSVIALTPSTAKIIFVVFNVSDESDSGGLVGVQINSTDVAAVTGITNQSLSTNWTGLASANRTISSNVLNNHVLRILPVGWQSLIIPSQTIMESVGRTAGTTQNFNMSKIFYSLRTNYRFIYYNTDGTSSGWKLYDRTDWAGSSLQYANNTNSNAYWINMTAEDSFEL